MENERFRCRHCGKLKTRKTADQRYCGDDACQKARKNAWRRERYAADPEYRLNQRESTRAWLEANAGAAEYYRQYRRRGKQRRKGSSRAKGAAKNVEDSFTICRETTSANSDALLSKSLTILGRYEIVPLGGANSDAFEAEIRVISRC